MVGNVWVKCQVCDTQCPSIDVESSGRCCGRRHGLPTHATLSLRYQYNTRIVTWTVLLRTRYICSVSHDRPEVMQPAHCRTWRLHVLHQRPFEVQARKSRAACRRRITAETEQPSSGQPLVPIGQAAALAASLHLALTAGPSLAREAAGVVPLRRAVVEEMLVQQLSERVRQLSDSELAVALEQVLAGQKQFPAELLLPHQQPASAFGAGNAATTSSTAAPPTPPSQGAVPPTPSVPSSPLDFFQQPFSLWPSSQQPEAQQQQQQQQAAKDSMGEGGGSSAKQGADPARPVPEAKPSGESVAGQQAEEVDLTQQLFEKFAQLAEQQKQAEQQAGADSKPTPPHPGGRAAGTGSNESSGLAAAATQPQFEAAVGSLVTWLGSPFAQVLLPRLVGGAVLVVLALSQFSKLLAWVAGSPSEQPGAAAAAAVDEEGEGSTVGPPTPAAASAGTAAPTTVEQPKPFWSSWFGRKAAGAETASAPSVATSPGGRAASQQSAPPAVGQEQPEQGQEPQPQPGSSAWPQQPPTGVVWVRKEASPGGEQPQQPAPGNLPPPPPPTAPNGSIGPAGAFAAATQAAVAAGLPAGGPILWQRQADSVPAGQQSSLPGEIGGPALGSATSGGAEQPSWPGAAAVAETGSWLAAAAGKQGERVARSGQSSLRDVDLWSLPLEELRGLKADDWLSARDWALRHAPDTQPAAPTTAPSTAAADAAMAVSSGVSTASQGVYTRGSPVQRGGAPGQGLPSRRHHSLLDNAEPADFTVLVPPACQSNGQAG